MSDFKADYTINSNDMLDVCRRVVKFGGKKGGSYNDAVIEFFSDGVEISFNGISMMVNGQGNGQGRAFISLRYFSSIGEVAKSHATIHLRVNENRLYAESYSVPCRWMDIHNKRQIELPMDPPLIEILRLRYRFTDEEINASCYKKQLERAEKQKDELIKNAVAKLAVLGVTRQHLEGILEGILKEV